MAIAEDRHCRRRQKCREVGDENHRAIIQARNVNLRRTLALEKIIVELRQAKRIQHAAVKRLMVVAALAIDSGPEAGAAQPFDIVPGALVASAGNDFVQAGRVRAGLDEHRGFAPASAARGCGIAGRSNCQRDRPTRESSMVCCRRCADILRPSRSPRRRRFPFRDRPR